MGNVCSSSDVATKEQYQNHDRIERMLAKTKTGQNDLKMLLLGTGDSGKSTIAKQMRILYLNGFNTEERKKWKSIIQHNIINYTKLLIDNMHKFGYEYEKPENVENEARVLDTISKSDITQLTPELADLVDQIWKDAGIQATWERACDFQISDSASYFIPRAKEFALEGYDVTNDDVLHTRVKTTGIVEIEFTVEKETFKLVDVGGQRSERKKWIHCFQDVTAIIFVVAMSEYNLCLEENGTINRMLESLKLFDDIVNNMWFNKTNIILFLNKQDIFEEKIQKIDLKICFPDYPHGKNYDRAREYIREQYHKRDKFGEERKIYPHFTCATKTDNIKHVWTATKEMLLLKTIEILNIV
eukprot:TRINITY_DN5231_c1_g1_i1.p1 TRINITY_DN5231_c1_g1~~TRINITY_DN5231_c1_g1_i1.p1  ORF type:complete len:357 (-),score=87.89 TRINITY_DN5231_c1_g1_i1:232-1302(-)